MSQSRHYLRGVLQLLAGTLVSKATGVVREIAFAAWFGTSDVAAAFRISQSAFYQPIQALTGDTLGASFLPLYNRTREEDTEAARVLAYVTFFCALVVGVPIAAVLLFLPGSVVGLLAPGVPAGVQAQAIMMVQIMAVAAPLYILSNAMGYVEAAHGSFAAISSRPALLNIGGLVGGGLTVLSGREVWLAWGGFGIQIAFFAWTAVKFLKLDPIPPRLALLRLYGGRCLKALLRNSAPLLLIPLAAQIGIAIERIVASELGTPVVPALEYSRFICETTLSLSAIPLSIVTLASHGGSSRDTVRAHAQATGGFLLLVSVPVSAFLQTNAHDLIQAIFARGAFTAHSVDLTASILAGATLGLGGTVTSYFLIKALNANLRNVETVTITAIGFLCNALFDVLAWHSLGAATLGYGASLNGVVTFAICTTRLQLWRGFAPLLGVLAGGYLATMLLHRCLPAAHWAIARLAVQAAGATLVWITLYAIAPPLRRTARPLVERLGGLLGRRGASRGAT
jgi:putative peptidoglycan lipid II flippase